MTSIKFDFRLADEEPTLSGRLEIRPIKRLHFEDPLDFIMLPVNQIVPVVNSVATVELRPSGIDWCWVIKERFKGGTTRHVVVPDSPTPIEYGDLVDVNPDTLSPEAEPEAAWWVALENAIIGGGGGSGTLTSVNGKSGDSSGAVVLNAADVGARPATWVPSVGEVNGLTAALDGKQPTGDYVTAVQFSDGLAGKQATGDYATNSALSSGLASKRDATWTPLPSDVGITATGQRMPVATAPGTWLANGLTVNQAAGGNSIAQRSSTGQLAVVAATVDANAVNKLQLDAGLATKQATGDYATNTALTTGLAGKAATTHTHTISDVTNLQGALDGKQAAGNYATVSYVDAQVAAVPRFVPVATTDAPAVTAAPIGTAFLVA